MSDPQQQDWFAANAPPLKTPTLSGDWFADNAPPKAAQPEDKTPSMSPGEVQRLHDLYDSRPLWRKIAGAEPDQASLNDGDKALLQRARDIGKQGAQHLTEGVVTGMGEGAKTAAKMAPFMLLPKAGAMAEAAAGGGAMGTVANLGVQGGGAAAITGLEGGSKEDAALAGLTGMAGPVGDKLISAASPAAENVAERVYQSALKPPPGSYTTPEVQSMVRTGLDNKIPVSEAGAQKLGALISDLNDKIKGDIAANSNAPIDKFAVASRLKGTEAKFANQVNPEADLAAIQDAGEQFMRNPAGEMRGGAAGPGPFPMSAQAAQEMKQGTYQQLKDRSFGELGSATKESQKALARGIKEELETVFPEIKSDNSRLSKFYGLDEALERAVRRIDNREIFGLGAKIAGSGAATLGGLATGSAGEGALLGGASAIMAKALSDPMVKSRIAIMLGNAAKIGPSAANARVASYIAQLGNGAMSAHDVLQLGGGPVALPQQP